MCRTTHHQQKTKQTRCITIHQTFHTAMSRISRLHKNNSFKETLRSEEEEKIKNFNYEKNAKLTFCLRKLHLTRSWRMLESNKKNENKENVFKAWTALLVIIILIGKISEGFDKVEVKINEKKMTQWKQNSNWQSFCWWSFVHKSRKICKQK